MQKMWIGDVLAGLEWDLGRQNVKIDEECIDEGSAM